MRQIDRAALIEGDQQAVLGALHGCDGRAAADHILVHDGGFLGRAGGLVIMLQGHDQHGVRIIAELDQIGHAPDHCTVGRDRKSCLIDGSVSGGKPVIQAAELPARLVPVGFRPVLILRLQDTPHLVA
jgi:hypothetical protein